MLFREKLLLLVGTGVWIASCNTLWKAPKLIQMKEYAAIAHLFVPKSDGSAFATKDSAPQVLIRREDSEGMISIVGGNVDVDAGLWENQHNLVHIVHTQFMPNQPALLHLGMANFELLRVFTIPSMVHQTNKQFLWLVWVPPQLHREIRQALVKEVSRFPNTIVLSGKKDARRDFRSLHGLSFAEMDDDILAGDRQILLDYYAASQMRLLVESRLDTGDAFSVNFVESVQAQAVSTVARSSNPMRVEVLCPEDHMEWRHQKRGDERDEQGHLIHFHNRDFCVNTGRSIVYNIKGSARQLKVLEEMSVREGIEECRPEIVDKEEKKGEECTGHGTQTVAYDRNDLHRNSCPSGSFFCRGYNGEKVEFGGPVFNPRSEVLECKVDDSIDSILVAVSVSRTKSREQTGIKLVLDGDYMMAAVYMKGGPGGNLYVWDWDGKTGGAKSGNFVTPDDHAIGHVDLCVIPKETLCEKSKVLAMPESEARNLALNDTKTTNTPPKIQNVCRRYIQMVDFDDQNNHKYVRNAVLLSNSPAVIGVKNVIPRQYRKTHSVAESTFESKESQEDAWMVLEHDFGVSIEKVISVRRTLDDDMESILIDSISGLCNNRFSCMESTKKTLEVLLQKVRHFRRRKGLPLAEDWDTLGPEAG